MGMTAGGARGAHLSSINVTPMIDVLLVLLIIFMVVQGQLQRGLSVQVPPPPEAESPPVPAENLVLEVLPGGAFRLNQQPLEGATLRSELARVLGARERKVLFVKGDETVPYREVVAAVDVSRAAGAAVIGLVPH